MCYLECVITNMSELMCHELILFGCPCAVVPHDLMSPFWRSPSACSEEKKCSEKKTCSPCVVGLHVLSSSIVVFILVLATARQFSNLDGGKLALAAKRAVRLWKQLYSRESDSFRWKLPSTRLRFSGARSQAFLQPWWWVSFRSAPLAVGPINDPQCIQPLLVTHRAPRKHSTDKCRREGWICLKKKKKHVAQGSNGSQRPDISCCHRQDRHV